MNTRSNGSCVVLPKMHTETGKIFCLSGSPHFQPTWKKNLWWNIHCAFQRETKTTEVSVDAQEKKFLTLVNSYSLIVHYSFNSAFYVDFNRNECQ